MAAHVGSPNDSPAYRFQGSTSNPQATVTHTHTHERTPGSAIFYFVTFIGRRQRNTKNVPIVRWGNRCRLAFKIRSE